MLTSRSKTSIVIKCLVINSFYFPTSQDIIQTKANTGLKDLTNYANCK